MYNNYERSVMYNCEAQVKRCASSVIQIAHETNGLCCSAS
jgi:hypothetical protein